MYNQHDNQHEVAAVRVDPSAAEAAIERVKERLEEVLSAISHQSEGGDSAAAGDSI
jgi:hypothetical protein